MTLCVGFSELCERLLSLTIIASWHRVLDLRPRVNQSLSVFPGLKYTGMSCLEKVLLSFSEGPLT